MSDKLKRIFIPGIMDAEIEVDEAMLAAAVAEYIAEHPVSVTVDSELSGTSENPVQNKVIKLALDQKGTYSKPSGGIPASDLASDVAASLGKADTAVQQIEIIDMATETWVEGKGYQTEQDVQTAINTAVSGKLDTAQGAANAGKFMVVGSDGNIAAVAMTAWQGGSY